MSPARLVEDLAESCLVVQGPPGTGKTRTAADIAVDVVDRGLRVAVTASAHRIITNLVDAISDRARAKGVEVSIVQRGDEGEVSTRVGVQRANSIAEAVSAFDNGAQVVAGTPWLLSSPQWRDRFDTVIIDEAGKLSLADALAVGTAGANLVLVGDQQQLEQPIKGVHPPGADRSALDHYIDGPTVGPHRGVFLRNTRRMHPSITDAVSKTFYQGRLQSHGSVAKQRVLGPSALAGRGLRFVWVDHLVNRSAASPEEAVTVHRIFDQLLGSAWIAPDGETRVITARDIIVTTPTNAHANAIVSALRSRDREMARQARVGTVDRMQGQEGAVSIYSMAATTSKDATRSFEFLYDMNRLNVAVTRGRAVSVIVASPDLLTGIGTTPEQLRMANALNSIAESSLVLDEFLQVSRIPMTMRPSTAPSTAPLIGTPQPVVLGRSLQLDL